MNPNDRRAVIIAAVREIVATKGIEAVSLKTTAERCRIRTSRQTVKHYFGSRAGLITAAFPFGR